MPDSVKELFTYNPHKAKQLLAEAGYPKGFSFKVQVCSCSPTTGPAPAGRRLSGTGRRQDRNPADGIWRVPLRHDDEDQHARLFHEQRTHQSDPSLRKSFYTKESVWNPSQWSDPSFDSGSTRCTARATRRNGSSMIRELTREIGRGALYLAADAATVHRLVAVGEELRRRTARRRGAARPDLRPHLARPGAEEEDGAFEELRLGPCRHCERSEAIQSSA